MNLFKKISISLASILACIYLVFLLVPFILSPIANSYLPLVQDEIKKSIGFNSQIEGLKIITTPKLTIGAKLKIFEILTPENKEIFEAENFEIKMSLIPLLAKKIELDLVKVENINIKLNVNPDGSFEAEKFLPKIEDTQNLDSNTENTADIKIPFGIRLSNHLPDIKINNYNIEFIDIQTNKKYEIKGEKTEITDFILNKGFKAIANGCSKFNERNQFIYKLKINNKIMPDIDLHELVFEPQKDTSKKEKKEAPDFKINILDVFKGIYNNKITANLDANLTLTKNGNNGYIKADNLSIINLPPSFACLDFNGHKINIDSNIYTAKEEFSTIKGSIKSGKKPNIDLNIKSNIQLNNIIKILNAIATTFNIKDLQTLSATGELDANLNIKSDFKTLISDGYLKIPNANVYYELYKIGIDNINANILLVGNNIDIKNIGFSILNQPLKFYGKIKQDASADLHLLAENLSLKGLIIACGQTTLLKENPINSGSISLKADIVGKLDKIQPTANVELNNIDIKNIPSNTRIKLPYTKLSLKSDGKTFLGNAHSEKINIINPVATVDIPKVNANIKENEIEIVQTPVKIEKINFNVAGKIKNYLSEKVSLNIITEGDIKSSLNGEINITKQILNLIFATKENSTIIVPMFDKSKMIFNGNINITGNMMNPILSGTVNVPSLSIPEIPIVIENLIAKLNGPIIKGNATLGKFSSGEIVAENCISDFSMKGENFYLNNIKGNAFDGKINGNIIYNMSNLNTKIDFQGTNMNAEKAVKGAVGIPNALSGTLGFDTNLTLKAVDYDDMIRSMKGNLSFKVTNGSFGNIGRLENFFNANNIIGNTILKTTVSTLSNLSAVKNTAKYNYITGNMNFSNGWVNIENIKSSGETLAYYVYGKLHLINMSTNLTILGRLDQSVVTLLGPLGELSVDKLLSAIPKFGTLTASIANSITSDPKGEKISEIPTLTNGGNAYKDFKVIFNGGLESSNSIKSFKWLTKIDTSALEPQIDVKETIKTIKTSIGSDVDNVINQVKVQKDALKNTANELKNIFKF